MPGAAFVCFAGYEHRVSYVHFISALVNSHYSSIHCWLVSVGDLWTQLIRVWGWNFKEVIILYYYIDEGNLDTKNSSSNQ